MDDMSLRTKVPKYSTNEKYQQHEIEVSSVCVSKLYVHKKWSSSFAGSSICFTKNLTCDAVDQKN